MLIASYYSSPPPAEVIERAKLIGFCFLALPIVIGFLIRRRFWRGLALGSLLTGLAWGAAANWAYSYGGGDMGGLEQAVQTVRMFLFGLLAGALTALTVATLNARYRTKQ